jgi:hypothetical protein
MKIAASRAPFMWIATTSASQGGKPLNESEIMGWRRLAVNEAGTGDWLLLYRETGEGFPRAGGPNSGRGGFARILSRSIQ